jgi:hypothetical protein
MLETKGSSPTTSAHSDPARPDFMVNLGLVPPYTVEDVQMAYREKAKDVHPDRGGVAGDFIRLKESYERALEYLRFTPNRRQWLGDKVERYLAQEAVIAEVRRRGGQVTVQPVEWARSTFGPDFAQIMEQLTSIRLRNQSDGDALLEFLAPHQPALKHLVNLDLSGCRVSDEGLRHLWNLEALQNLDLANSPLTESAALDLLQWLPALRFLNLADTPIGWWARRRLRQRFPKVQLNATGSQASLTAKRF